jgi:hypothetical protein
MMASVFDDAKESLLQDMKDRSHLNEKNALQRRRSVNAWNEISFTS